MSPPTCQSHTCPRRRLVVPRVFWRPGASGIETRIGPTVTARWWLPRALTPLTHVGYRRLAVVLVMVEFSGGAWGVALVWEVIRIGGGPGQLSVVSTCGAIGIVATAMFGGVVADRFAQKWILVVVAIVELGCMGVICVFSLLDETRLWQLAAASTLIGITSAFYFPAYSAWLPLLVPPEDLLAANGVEGILRPVVGQAMGPAVAGVIVGAASPGAAIAVSCLSYLVGLAVLAAVPSATANTAEQMGTPAGFRTQLADGIRYVLGTRWILVTLLFASVMILCTAGPLLILVPFVVKDQLGSGPEAYALVVAALGVGAAIGSLVTASLPLPRRYLTVPTVMWACGCLPLLVMGAPGRLLTLLAAAAAFGALSASAMVIWNTLLQRLVPPTFRGRVSSLDFVISLALAPVSMAVAGPVATAIGVRLTFAVAALLPAASAVLALTVGGLARDERVDRGQSRGPDHPFP